MNGFVDNLAELWRGAVVVGLGVTLSLLSRWIVGRQLRASRPCAARLFAHAERDGRTGAGTHALAELDGESAASVLGHWLKQKATEPRGRRH